MKFTLPYNNLFSLPYNAPSSFKNKLCMYITTGHLNSQHQAEFELFSTEVELRNLKVIAIVFKLFIPREDTSKTVAPAQNAAMTESLSSSTQTIQLTQCTSSTVLILTVDGVE